MTANLLGRPIRVAMIGCGVQGTNHSRILQGLGPELVEVAALCDSSPQRLSEAASSWPKARTASNYREALDAADLDLVIIATMPNTHAEIAISAMESGAAVLCEKPFTLSVQEAVAVLEASDRTGRQVQLGTNMRYMPECRFLRDIVASGDVGNVVACKTWGCHFSPPVWGPHYRRELAGGRVLASTQVHALDLSMWVGGLPNPVAVSDFSGRLIS
jgi:predicted dehydrogenase